jgi:prepilin-type N-terminal cleavage/methylation domain-containing protein
MILENRASTACGRIPFQGFTLLEVVIVLAITGLLAAVFVPSFFSEQDPAEEAAREIRQFCRSTRAEALLIGEPRFLQISTNGLMLKGGETRSVVLPPGWTLEVRRSAERKFRKPFKNEVWEINGEGICEPLAFKLSGQGESYEMGFDPLTALEPLEE